MKSNSRLVLGSMLLAGLAVGWAAGCGSTNLRAQATLGPAGGSLSIPSEGVRLDVPPGALGSPVDVSLTASSDSRGVLIGIEPAQLVLSRAATLGVTLSNPLHIASVTEVTSGGEVPIGVMSRIETASGSSTALSLDRFMQVRVSTETLPDGGTAPGACREHENGEGDQGDGEHADGDHRDGGMGGDGDDDAHDGGSGEHHLDGGTMASMACPSGFECDDGVCVAPGGDDEDEHQPCAMDAGVCSPSQVCDDGRCKTMRDGGHEDEHLDGGHDDDDDHRDGGER